VIILILALEFSTLNSLAQTTNRKEIKFNGTRMKIYEKPIRVSSNPEVYEAYYRNMGETLNQGKVVIDESSKTITIKYHDGVMYECIYTKIENKNEPERWLGDVEKTIYNGKWKQDNSECSLEIMKTTEIGCVITLNSRRFVDDDYGIDVWQKITTFITDGSCLD
jgi:hypothetical protein